jgi:putative effector of murein hydrolase LrgA (UPF0299 family)
MSAYTSDETHQELLGISGTIFVLVLLFMLFYFGVVSTYFCS